MVAKQGAPRQNQLYFVPNGVPLDDPGQAVCKEEDDGKSLGDGLRIILRSRSLEHILSIPVPCS